MNQIIKERLEELINKGNVELSATQGRVFIPVIYRFYIKMQLGIPFSPIKVKDKLICEGHHRYLASLLAAVPIDRTEYHTTGATMITSWETLEWLEEDYYSPEQIDKFNREDAEFLKIPLETIVNSLKNG